MDFYELRNSAENQTDHRIVFMFIKQSDHTIIKIVAGMIFPPVNDYNHAIDTDIKLANWSDQSFSYFATYAFLLYQYKTTCRKNTVIEKTVYMLMESLTSTLIDHNTKVNIRETLLDMQQGMGISKKFLTSLINYFVYLKEDIVALQSEYLNV